MSRLDDLERLSALREKGVLTWEEFLAEKAKLPLDSEGSRRSRWLWPKNAYLFRRSRWATLAVITGVLIVLGVKCADKASSFLSHATGDLRTTQPKSIAGSESFSSIIEASAHEAEKVPSEEPDVKGWTLSNKIDPMTDIVSDIATQIMRSNPATVQLTISCAETGAIRYEATTFNSEGEILAMRTTTPQFNGASFIPYDVRIDSEDKTSYLSGAQFSNQVATESGSNPFAVTVVRENGKSINVDPVVQMARGMRVILGLHFENGDEDFTIDQSSPEIRALLRPCIQKADASAETTE